MQMPVVWQSTLFPCTKPSVHLQPHKKSGRRYWRHHTLAKRSEVSGEEEEESRSTRIFPPLRFSKSLVATSAIALFGLGFIDAGYSGDWSRIGVISRETEDFLKAAAFFVVPLCLFLIYSISDKEKTSS